MTMIPLAKIFQSKIRFTIFLMMVLSFLPAGLLAAQDRDGDSGRYIILNAQYGTEHRNVDVTPRLRELARRDRQFRVEYDSIQADPAPGRPKVLRVFAREPDGHERAFDFPDGSIFDGTQFRGWARGDWGEEHWNGGWNGRSGDNHDGPRQDFRDDRDGDRRDDHHDSGEFVILSAQYGTERRHVDVTHRLKELARRDRRFLMDNHTFGVDPDYGHRKVLRIYARGPEGRERMFEYPEHGWVDGAQFRSWGSGDWSHGDDHWSGRWNVEEHDRH